MAQTDNRGFCSMPHYYIHIDDGREQLIDEVGSDFSSRAQAMEEVVHTASGVLHDELLQGRQALTITIFLEDETHKRLVSMAISASVQDES